MYKRQDEWDAEDPLRYRHELATMGCRTRVFENINGPRTSIGRGNLSFTTINLPRLAIEAMRYAKAVSYTHLDVYKRQAPHCRCEASSPADSRSAFGYA